MARMNRKFVAYLLISIICLLEANCYSTEGITIEQLKRIYNYPNAKRILYYGESNLDNDEELEKIIVVFGEFSFAKLLIIKKEKIISVIDIDATPAEAKVLNIYYKDILDLKYNQIIMEIYFPVYGRSNAEEKYLYLVSYLNGDYKQIFSYEIERKAKDNFDGWKQYIKYDYLITAGKNAKIILTIIENSLIDVNKNLLEPPKLDKKEEYIWNGAEFKRVK